MSEDQMAPDASPDAVKPKSGVRRVNNMPMYLIGGVLGIFLLVMALVAADRAAQQNQPGAAKAEKAGSTSMLADEIAGKQQDGIIKAKPLEIPPEQTAQQPTTELTPAPAQGTTITVARPENLDQPPTPPQGARNEDLDRIRMAKLQMLEEAIKAKTTVRIDAPRSQGSAGGGAPQGREETLARIQELRRQAENARATDPTAAYQAALAQARTMGGAAGGGGMGGSGAPTLVQTSNRSGGGAGYGSFDNRSEGDRWRLDSQPEAPATPYVLRAGFVVPATLISGINSDLPGQIMAQVSQSVYDTATGKHMLIPQGSRLVGSYSNDVAYGQKRVLVAWQRIIFPDGKAMDIGAMPGGDSAGYAGFNDKVNNHYFRTFASAFLMSGVVAGISLSQDRGNSNSGYGRQDAGSAMSEALGQQLGQVTAQMIAKNLNIAPTLEIRPGYRFNVIVTKDMTFSKPYQAFDY